MTTRRVLLGLSLVACHVASASADPLALQPGAGADTTSAVCASCHTSDYIIMNSVFLTPQAWKAEVTKMRTLYGAPIDDQTAVEITDYLGKHYAASASP